MRKEIRIYKKGILTTLASTLLLTTVLAIRLTWQTKSPKQIFVGPVPPYDFVSIQEAINNATEGDIIEVTDEGSPYIENVVVNKSVTIRRWTALAPQCIVDGKRTGPVFNVTASNVRIFNLTIQNGTYGIYLSSTSTSNILAFNNVTLNTRGIYMNNSASNTLTNNTIVGNYRNLDVIGYYLTQNISTSNTVNGRPVYYLVNGTDESVPLDAGFVAIINCTNIIVENMPQPLRNNTKGIFVYSSANITMKNLDIRYNDVGISLVGSYGSTIENTTIQYNSLGIGLSNSDLNTIHCNRFLQTGSTSMGGIELLYSDNNTIHDNFILQGSYGIKMENSMANIVDTNVVSNSSMIGIYLNYCDHNTFFGNNVTYTTLFGVGVESSNNNMFFHNNIMYNQNPQFVSESLNNWDNGREGNYWTSYSGMDVNKDGIGDTQYVFENIDRYPLMKPWNSFRILDITSINPTQYFITISSDHVIASLKFHLSYNATWNEGYVYFNITAGSSGYCNVTIPRERLDYHLYLVVNDPENVSYTVMVNATHSILSLTYSEGQYMVKIIGERVGTLFGDITGPEGVPDGKVDMRDIGAACNNFGENVYLNPIDISEDQYG